MIRTTLALPLAAALLAGTPTAQTNPIQLSIGAVDTASGKIDIYMANTVPIAGFQFTLKDKAGNPINLLGGSGGTAGVAGFTVFGGPNGIAIGLSFNLISIPSSGGNHLLLTKLDFTGNPKDICMSEIVMADTNIPPQGIPTDGGPCVAVPPVDCNSNGIDDATDIFQGGSADVDGNGIPDECQELIADPGSISISSGGTQTFALNAPTHAGEYYFLVGSVSGTSPGTPVGTVLLPLNMDAYLLFSLQNANVPPFAATFGFLDAAGKGIATLTIPPASPPGLVGATAHHAFVALDTVTLAPTLASNAVALALTP